MRPLVSVFLLTSSLLTAADLRVGLIGLDTSHVIAFTKLLNDPSDPAHVPGAKVVAGFRGGSPDLASSRERLDEYTAQLQHDFGVRMVPDIPTLCSQVDAVLLTSVDGRKHLEQVKPVFEAGKRVFIDKPLASTLEDALEIARLGKTHGVPWWSASSLRYVPAVADARVEGLTGAVTWGPAPLEPTQQLDLAWYGIHPIELLYAIMGPGCLRVARTYTEGADVIAGVWEDGRVGTVRTIRKGKSGYGAIGFGSEEIKISDRGGAAYAALLERVVEFFQTGVPPVPNEETLEIFRFMDAALRSKQNHGAATPLR